MPKAVKTSRDQQARDTRKRIVQAAHEEFAAQGYQGALMASIAERAGVSVQMVYFAFGKKPLLFLAAIQAAIFGDEVVPPPRTQWWQDAGRADSAQQVIAQFIRSSGPIFARAAPLIVVARVGAEIDQEIRDEQVEGDRLRAEDYRSVIAVAAGKGRFLPGVDEDAATDILVSMVSPTLYVELTRERSWTHERTIEWLAATVPGLIFEA